MIEFFTDGKISVVRRSGRETEILHNRQPWRVESHREYSPRSPFVVPIFFEIIAGLTVLTAACREG
jgi:hypothetical protein